MRINQLKTKSILISKTWTAMTEAQLEKVQASQWTCTWPIHLKISDIAKYTDNLKWSAIDFPVPNWMQQKMIRS